VSPDPETPSERVALVVWYMMGLGVALSTREVADLVGINRSSAYCLMARISRVIPIYLDAGVWRVCAQQPNGYAVK
jgi:hypothetical protein